MYFEVGDRVRAKYGTLGGGYVRRRMLDNNEELYYLVLFDTFAKEFT